MMRSAVTLIPKSDAIGALLVMAHPHRWDRLLTLNPPWPLGWFARRHINHHRPLAPIADLRVRPTYTMRLPSVALLVLLACAGCTHPTPSSPTRRSSSSPSREALASQLRQNLQTVTVADGISKPEADIVAECYFHQNVGCGGYTGIRDGGDVWIVDGAFGVAAKPIKGFYIDKSTGRITSPIGPSYATPFEIFAKPRQTCCSQGRSSARVPDRIPSARPA
jgi:hypothetical protein